MGKLLTGAIKFRRLRRRMIQAARSMRRSRGSPRPRLRPRARLEDLECGVIGGGEVGVELDVVEEVVAELGELGPPATPNSGETCLPAAVLFQTRTIWNPE